MSTLVTVDRGQVSQPIGSSTFHGVAVRAAIPTSPNPSPSDQGEPRTISHHDPSIVRRSLRDLRVGLKIDHHGREGPMRIGAIGAIGSKAIAQLA